MIYIVCVGNLKEKYLTDACNEYIKRISRYSKIEVIECKESQLTPYQVALKSEAMDIKKHLKGFVIKMAINGKQLASEEVAKKFEQINEQFVRLLPMSTNPIHNVLTIDLKETEFKIIGKAIGNFGRF